MNRATRRQAERASRRAPSRTADPLAAFRALKTARAATSVDRLDTSQLTDLALGYHGALTALMQGKGGWDDCNTLALAANVALMLCEYGLGDDEIDFVKAAQEAIVRLVQRGTVGGRYVLTGAEIRSLQALLALHDAQLAHEACTEGVMVAALKVIKRRMASGNVLEAA
jgi:hypothetical protein